MRYLHDYLTERIQEINELLASRKHEEKRHLLEFERDVYQELLARIQEVVKKNGDRDS
jgi:hypothetical protein